MLLIKVLMIIMNTVVSVLISRLICHTGCTNDAHGVEKAPNRKPKRPHHRRRKCKYQTGNNAELFSVLTGTLSSINMYEIYSKHRHSAKTKQHHRTPAPTNHTGWPTATLYKTNSGRTKQKNIFFALFCSIRAVSSRPVRFHIAFQWIKVRSESFDAHSEWNSIKYQFGHTLQPTVKSQIYWVQYTDTD